VIELDRRPQDLRQADDEYKKLHKKQESVLTHEEVLAGIGVFRMICNNPRAVLASAEKRLDWWAETRGR